MSARVEPTDGQALAIAVKIATRAEELLAPLKREMRLAGWRPEHRAIMWNAIARKALKLALEAERG